MRIRIAGYIQDSIVDGPGMRMTVFVQGCIHGCNGCHNPETWSFTGGRMTTTEELINILKSNPLISGLTISGGEPFCQANACAELAKEAHKLNKNVWVYTGYTYEDLKLKKEKYTNIKNLLKETDVLVDGPFVKDEKSLSLLFRGSKNQRLIDIKKTKESGEIVLWKE